MKILSSFLLLFLTIVTYAQVHVKGYYRRDGTYVRSHERTRPNSTVTDNYSYPGNYNPNLEYNTPLPKTTYNYYNNSSSSSSSSSTSGSNYGKEWVSGYYRSDGTYVSGYYRAKRNATSSSSNYSNHSSSNNYSSSVKSSSLSTKKFVNTTKVNFRTSPETGDNIIGELQFADEVTSVATVGYWDKVKVKRYDSQTYSYVTFDGYINSRFLSDYSSTSSYSKAETSAYNTSSGANYSSTSYESKYFMIISNKAYFHSTPDVKDRMKAYLIYGETIKGIAESKYFVYTEFTNASGIKTIGWILKDDLIRN